MKLALPLLLHSPPENEAEVCLSNRPREFHLWLFAELTSHT